MLPCTASAVRNREWLTWVALTQSFSPQGLTVLGNPLRTHSRGCFWPLFLTSCWPKVLSSLTHGLLHGAAHNVAASFSRLRQRESVQAKSSEVTQQHDGSYSPTLVGREGPQGRGAWGISTRSGQWLRPSWKLATQALLIRRFEVWGGVGSDRLSVPSPVLPAKIKRFQNLSRTHNP